MKYLYVRECKIRNTINTERLLFNYLQEKGERIFNDGFQSADIGLYRVEEQD